MNPVNHTWLSGNINFRPLVRAHPAPGGYIGDSVLTPTKVRVLCQLMVDNRYQPQRLLSKSLHGMRFLLISGVGDVAGVRELIAKHRTNIGRLPVEPWNDIPTSIVVRKQIRLKIFT